MLTRATQRQKGFLTHITGVMGKKRKSRVFRFFYTSLIFSSLVRIHIYVVPFLMLRFGLCTLLNPFGVASRMTGNGSSSAREGEV